MKCIRCGTLCRDTASCPFCGADLARAREDSIYLTDLTIPSRPFRTLASAARFALIANISISFVALLFNQILLPLPILLSAGGVVLLAGRHRASDPELPLSPTPGILFSLSVFLRALACALVEAVGISVCLGGRTILDRLLNLLNQYTGTDLFALYNDTLMEFGLSISETEFYLALYAVAVLCMFAAGIGLILNGIGFMFFHSFRASVKTNKPDLPLLGAFSVVLMIDGIFNLFMLFSSADLFSLVSYGTTAYFNICASLCLRQLKQTFK